MRELVCAIDNHMETVDLEITSNLNSTKDVQAQQPLTDQPTKDAPERQAEDIVQLPLTYPLV